MTSSNMSPTTTAGSGLPSLDPNGGGGGGTGQSANYFFGFLITFAVLLVVFVIAGLFSRRRVQARHAAMMGQMGAGDPWVFGPNLPEDVGRRIKPVWMERWVEDPEMAREKEKDATIDVDGVPERGKWKNIMPLCATLTLPEINTKPEADVGPGKVRRGSIATISSWFSSFNTTKDKSAVSEEENAPPVVSKEALQDSDARVDLIVMVAMPRGPYSRGYEFGVTSVPVAANHEVDMTGVT
ncbi:hypothetical protein H0H87_010867 [Tephrocybe sp. NHM501043]|nr:hypothetical protein H0H87_010867 [Tephrocybe sp. NHM501043]